MDFLEFFFICLGSAVVVYCGVKLILFSRMLCPKIWFPFPESFFSSMGEWAVVTGASEGIGRAYAFELAAREMNVVIISRTKNNLDQVAKDIGDATGRRVKVVVADFTEENVFTHIQDELKDLDVGVLVNNVGLMPAYLPLRYLESVAEEKIIQKLLNCNIKTMMKMCRIILPGMESRGRGVIVNISSGVASFSCPLLTLYASSKVFVDRFSQGLHAEYKSRGITVQAVAPFGVSTRMAGYRTTVVTLTPEDFVKSSLQYLRAGDTTFGSVCHMVMGFILQSIPLKILHSDTLQKTVQDITMRIRGQKSSTWTQR